MLLFGCRFVSAALVVETRTFKTDLDLIIACEAMGALTPEYVFEEACGFEVDSQDEFVPNDEPVAPLSEVDRQKEFEKIMNCIAIHTHVPVSPGHGQTSIEDKMSAFLRSLFLECRRALLELHLSMYVAIATDLGVESGMDSWQAYSLDPLFPDWLPSLGVSANFEWGL